jgi:hypothetical protein
VELPRWAGRDRHQHAYGDLTVDELMQAVRDYHAGKLDVSVLGG